MTERYRRNGKQVIADNLHFADARNEDAAAAIVRAMNLFDATRSIEPPRYDVPNCRCALVEMADTDVLVGEDEC